MFGGGPCVPSRGNHLQPQGRYSGRRGESLAHIGSTGPPSLFAVDHASSNAPCGRIELRYMLVWRAWVYIWDGKIIQESESVPRCISNRVFCAEAGPAIEMEK